MPDIHLIKLVCLRCSYTWWPRSETPPKYCPRCNSPYWNKERMKDRPVNALQDAVEGKR